VNDFGRSRSDDVGAVTIGYSACARLREIVSEAGFRTGFVSGSSIAAMRLAMPDMDLLTFPEMADAVETVISAAPNVLWLADGDTGYGNALAVQKTIRAYARRGAAAVLIEDKVWPRPLGHGGAKLVIERDAALLRCRAAAEACREEGILLLDDPGYFPASDGGASARGSQSSTVVPSPTLLRIRIAPRD
jgi:2-methylisocitrate lyase-like PEP mutase family enzyme